jgi:hexosaminidase
LLSSPRRRGPRPLPRISPIALCLFFAISTTLTAQPGRPGLIPQPVTVEYHEGSFLWSIQTPVILPNDNDELWGMADYLYRNIKESLGFAPVIAGKSLSQIPTVSFELSDPPDQILGNEGYLLHVDPQQIRIRANKKAGLFYGFQTLMQLIPPAAPGELLLMNKIHEVPAVTISDYPRFPWRGLMLDVSRHFFSLKDVKAYIDEMARYKFNVFHWHLSDDQGWRVEIKSLPRLTEIGAWRVPRTGLWWTFDPPAPGEKATEGGFYTQDQIREVVKYAAERQITILPEIDIPGHSLAMIAAYPELSSTGKQYPVNPGSKFYTIEDNALCPGKEAVYVALDKVFTELAPLFPGEYIHIGGDECYKGFWKNSPECQALMAKENLKSLEEVQSWFIKRVEKILQSKGKKMIGWDEILEGGLAPDATVMSWRGMDGGIQSAKMGHKVIMTPTQHCYLDLYQGDPAIEPATYSMLRLSDVYKFEPVPAGVKPELILGGQGNLWTESVATLRHAQYMTWPRSFALAEVLWSPLTARDWNSFMSRLPYQFQRLDAAGVNYSRSVYDPIINMVSENGIKKIVITCEVENYHLHYSFDESYPDAYYPTYFGPIDIPKGAGRIRAVAVKQMGGDVSRVVTIDLKELEKRMK